MLTLDEMIPVIEIVDNYPEGTLLKVWYKCARRGAAPRYAGLFVVADRSLRDAESGRVWGGEEGSGIDRGTPVYIVRVEAVDRPRDGPEAAVPRGLPTGRR